MTGPRHRSDAGAVNDSFLASDAVNDSFLTFGPDAVNDSFLTSDDMNESFTAVVSRGGGRP